MFISANLMPSTLSNSVRALGETDLNPVSGLGKLAQLAFAFLQPGNVIANIVAGGVAEAGAQQGECREGILVVSPRLRPERCPFSLS